MPVRRLFLRMPGQATMPLAVTSLVDACARDATVGAQVLDRDLSVLAEGKEIEGFIVWSFSDRGTAMLASEQRIGTPRRQS